MQLVGVRGEPLSLLKRPPDIGIAAARSDESEDDECVQARDRRELWVLEEEGGPIGGFGPATGIKLKARAVREHEQAEEVEIALARVCDPVLEHAVSDSIAIFSTACPARFVYARPACSSSPASSARSRLRSSLAIPPGSPRDASTFPTVFSACTRGSRIAKPLGELHRFRSPRDGCLAIVCEHPELRDRCIRHRELAAGLELLEKLDGLLRRFLGLRMDTDDLEQARQPSKLLRLLWPVTQSAIAVKRATTSAHRGLVFLDEVRLERVSLEQFGASSDRRSVGEPQSALVVPGCLTVGADRGSAFGSSGRVFERCIGVTGSLGMVSEAVEVEPTGWRRRQRGERPAVQVDATSRRQRILKSETRELVPEVDHVPACEHPRCKTLVQSNRTALVERA